MPISTNAAKASLKRLREQCVEVADRIPEFLKLCNELRASEKTLKEASLSNEEVFYWSASGIETLAEDERNDLLDRLGYCFELLDVILPITENSYQEYQEKLSKLPASDWAKQLTPEIGPFPVLRAPDGRFYHPTTSKFYDSMDELERTLDDQLPIE